MAKSEPSGKKKILITDRFASDSFYYLQRNPIFEVERLDSPFHLTPEKLLGVHGLIIRSRTRIDEKILAAAKQLQVIVTATSGFDHIDLEAAQKWGVTVMHTPEANRESAAQLTWALVLACANKLQAGHKQVKSGEWNRDALIGSELASQTYGIVGLGRIGSRVAEIANAFRMKVVAYDPYVDDSVFEKLNVERLSYEEVLKVSNVLSFHVPKTLETDNMLNRSQFEYIQRGIILINTSRGSVIHEDDLCYALENNWVSACGLDVYQKEPLPKSAKLLTYPSVILTPHVGANTEEAFQKASQLAALKINKFFEDSSTSDALPPRASWYGATPFKSE